MTRNLLLTTKKRAKSFFAKQCSLIENRSTLPSLFLLITDKSRSDVDFLIEGIKNIISKLDSCKAHVDDMISIRMIKLCHKSIRKPFNIIFKDKAFSHQNGKSKCRTNLQKNPQKPASSVLKPHNCLFSPNL